MFRLLPLIPGAILLLMPMLAKASTLDECATGFVTNTPEYVARSAFEGSDSVMPKGVTCQMAISPVRQANGKLAIPTTIPAAFRSLEDMLPHWYLNALRRSEGDNNCDVIVNGMSYGAVIMSWVRANWKLGAKSSALHREFQDLGFRYDDEIDQALAFGFCAYLKTDDNVRKGLDAIEQRSSNLHSPGDGGN